jgi:TonB family protein
LLGHAILFAIIARQALEATETATATAVAIDADAGSTLWSDAVTAAASPTWVDLRSVAETPLAPPQPEPPPEALATADQARRAQSESAPQRGTTEERVAAAADSGDRGGRMTSAAFRRDRSVLRTRLADNATDNQISRERTAATASSPQPVRQEPRVGVGDSSQSRRRRPADSAMPSEQLAADPDGIFDPQVTADAARSQQSDRGRALARTDGPLDTDQGRRRFDVDKVGVAQETRAVRAASDETHPGRLELSSAAAPGAGGGGEGPSDAPGAVARPSAGAAPAAYGATRDAPRGRDLTLSAAEREYLRELAEIQRRVHSTLVFPRRLALELEQGETVVHFVVRPDGRLEGNVRITKSAGFEEFDTEAVRAVTRAAPFPPMSQRRSFSMQIGFDNPMVR